MKLMIRAYKQGMNLPQVPLGTLIGTPVEDWATLPRAPLAYEPEPKSKAELQAEARAVAKGTGAKAAPEKKPKSAPISSPALGGTFPNLDRLLDAVIEKAIEPGPEIQGAKAAALGDNAGADPWAEEMPVLSESSA